MSGLNAESLRVPKTIKLFIGGEFPRTESGRSYPVYARAPGELYANLCRASRKDLRNAVTAAREAQPGWAGKTAYLRSQILYRMAEMTEGKRAEFIEVLTETLGQSKEQADAAVDEAIDALIYYGGFADKFSQVAGCVNPVSGPHHNFTTPEAVGVVGLVFGGPLRLGSLMARIASALCSGNAIVALLPEHGSAVIAPISEAMATSDLPKGVVNLLTGQVSELAGQFGTHMEIQSLSVEGLASETASQMQKDAAGNMKRFVLASERDADLSLERILDFVEFKTIWHPVGF